MARRVLGGLVVIAGIVVSLFLLAPPTSGECGEIPTCFWTDINGVSVCQDNCGGNCVCNGTCTTCLEPSIPVIHHTWNCRRQPDVSPQSAYRLVQADPGDGSGFWAVGAKYYVARTDWDTMQGSRHGGSFPCFLIDVGVMCDIIAGT